MKRTIKKILRLFLVFLSSFALVLCWFPAEAQANEYDGNTYSYTSSNLSGTVIFRYVLKTAEALGYTIPSMVEDFSPELVQFFKDYGVNTEGLAGSVLDLIVPEIHIDLHNSNLLEFFSDIKNWDLNDLDNDRDQFLLDVVFSDSSYLDTQLIYDAFEKKESLNPRSIDNINKFVRYKAYALSRGSAQDISGENISSDDWNSPSSINYRFGFYAGGDFFGNGAQKNISQIFGIQSDTYSYSSASGTIDYDSGRFVYSFSNSNNYFDNDMLRCTLNVSFPSNSGSFALSGSFTNSVVEGATSSVGNVFNLNSSSVVITLYFDNLLDGDFTIHWNDFVVGGVSAPDTPVYSVPDPSDPDYDFEKKIYDYVTTETDRLIDEYDISSFMSDIRNTFDDTPWLFYPLEFYNSVAQVLTDNYSETFDFTLEEMNFSSIADGFIIPHKEFHFDPVDLPNTVKALFRLFQWVLTFSYFWALINWGRSLILRFGSDSTHIDYEDN